MVMNGQQEAVEAYFKALSWNYPGETVENLEKSRS
jgi:hypothetical protein